MEDEKFRRMISEETGGPVDRLTLEQAIARVAQLAALGYTESIVVNDLRLRIERLEEQTGARAVADSDRTEYVVICRGDADATSEYRFAGYELATRTVFPTKDAAARYAATIAESRQAMVIPGRWAGLRRDAAERFPEG